MQKSYPYTYQGNYYGSMSPAPCANDYGSNPPAMYGGSGGGGYEDSYNTTPPPQTGPPGGPATNAALDAYRASCLMGGTGGTNGPGINCTGSAGDISQQQLMGQLAEGMYGRDALGYPGVMHPQSGLPDSMYWNKLPYGDPSNPHMGMDPGNVNCGHPGAMHAMHPGQSPPGLPGDPGCGTGNMTEFPWMKEKRHTTKKKSPSETSEVARITHTGNA